LNLFVDIRLGEARHTPSWELFGTVGCTVYRNQVFSACLFWWCFVSCLCIFLSISSSFILLCSKFFISVYLHGLWIRCFIQARMKWKQGFCTDYYHLLWLFVKDLYIRYFAVNVYGEASFLFKFTSKHVYRYRCSVLDRLILNILVHEHNCSGWWKMHFSCKASSIVMHVSWINDIYTPKATMVYYTNIHVTMD